MTDWGWFIVGALTGIVVSDVVAAGTFWAIGKFVGAVDESHDYEEWNEGEL